jgi:hypothetical protein
MGGAARERFDPHCAAAGKKVPHRCALEAVEAIGHRALDHRKNSLSHPVARRPSGPPRRCDQTPAAVLASDHSHADIVIVIIVVVVTFSGTGRPAAFSS